VTVLGGAELLETVTENLIDNALSFTPAGRQVRIRLRRFRGTAVLTVDDEGPGVAPEKLGVIFERYYSDRRAAPPQRGSSAAGNFGVGLWIVRRNVEAMGGQVRASNRQGGGLRMEVELRAA
jgi:two-component system, OmpR family, sensor histidine kinase ChvG